MFTNLKLVNRTRIIDNRNYENGLFLNRAERVENFSDKVMEELFNINNFNKLGYYFDTTTLYNKLSIYFDIDKDEMLITNGAEESIRYIFDIILEKNDKVMFPIPTYGMYHVYTKIYQTETILLEYNNDFKINREKLYSNLDKVKVLFLPNPSHIEDLFEADEIMKICKILEQTNGVLVVDETYFGFGAKSMIKLINTIDNIYIIRSLSKTFGLPSIRVGCLVSNQQNIAIISNYRPAYEISYPSFRISEYFLDNIEIVDNYIHDCIKGRNYIINKLNENNIIYNGINNYLLNIKINNEELCNKICSDLENNYIYVRNCKIYISITIGPIKYMQKFFKNFIDIYLYD